MELFHHLWTMLRHLSPETVNDFAVYVGPTLMYTVLFAIIFCETGLVVLPFLPGDSLLFAVGAVAASSSTISLPVVAVLLCVAANCGDIVNYFIGYRLGPKVFSVGSEEWKAAPASSDLTYATPRPSGSLLSRLLNRKHLKEAQDFYEKHGRKTIIMARFVPIVRTFAPFVAGIGRMNFLRFALFSVAGGILWVLVCLTAGYRLAKVDMVKKHFEIVVLVIIAVSLIPVVISYLKSRGEEKRRGVEVAATRGDQSG